MATLKINVMSIVAIIIMVAGVIAVALYEAPGWQSDRSDSFWHSQNAYEAMLIIAIILALVVLIVTCMDVERITGKTFLIYALAALLLLIGLICVGVGMEKIEVMLKPKGKFNYAIASIVFAVFALLAAVAGAVAPFVCNK